MYVAHSPTYGANWQVLWMNIEQQWWKIKINLNQSVSVIKHSVRFFAVGQCEFTALSHAENGLHWHWSAVSIYPENGFEIQLLATSLCYFKLTRKLRWTECQYDVFRIEITNSMFLFFTAIKRQNNPCLFCVVLMCFLFCTFCVWILHVEHSRFGHYRSLRSPNMQVWKW